LVSGGRLSTEDVVLLGILRRFGVKSRLGFLAGILDNGLRLGHLGLLLFSILLLLISEKSRGIKKIRMHIIIGWHLRLYRDFDVFNILSDFFQVWQI